MSFLHLWRFRHISTYYGILSVLCHFVRSNIKILKRGHFVRPDKTLVSRHFGKKRFCTFYTLLGTRFRSIFTKQRTVKMIPKTTRRMNFCQYVTVYRFQKNIEFVCSISVFYLYNIIVPLNELTRHG